MTGQEFKEIGQRLFNERQYEAAGRLLARAVESFPSEEQLWQELVLSTSWSGQHDNAVNFAKQAIRLHPRSDFLWRQLGSELISLNNLEEAEKALDNAKTLNPKAPWLWRYLANLHRKRTDHSKEIEAWEKLRELTELDANELCNLGIAYHNQGIYAKAVDFYRLSAAVAPSAAPFFNMGLVFNHPDVSQDADAADAFRRALAVDPKFDKAQERLQITKEKLLPLAERARSEASGLIRPDEFFQFYINPFEVFPIEYTGELAQLDPITIQRAKKRLLAEIDLNDGKVEWLENHVLDKSKALALENELFDEAKRRFHWIVFDNKQLLRFLTRGEVEHFLYSDDHFPKKLLEQLDNEPELLSFLSTAFAKQFNLLLTRAIERHAFAVVEVLFDGRRWVEPPDDDICFQGASTRVGDVVAQMRHIAEQGKIRRVDWNHIKSLFSEKAVLQLFDLLPTAFRPAQSQLVAHLRSLAIDCHNEHSDSDLAVRIIKLCRQFRFKSVDLTKQLEEDFKALEEILTDRQKHSYSACVRPGQAISVTHTGITLAGTSISAGEIEAIRWGIYVHTVNGIETEHSFTLSVTGELNQVVVRWDRRSVIKQLAGLFREREAVVPISELSTAEQDDCFQKMIDAVIHHLLPPLVTKLVVRITDASPLRIGECTLDKCGVSFQTQHFFFKKDHRLPWSDVETQMGKGQVYVISRSNRKVYLGMPARDTDNAVVLPLIANIMRERASNLPATVPPILS